ncbi:unnamed protein product, partial [Pleuronectes platessa]
AQFLAPPSRWRSRQPPLSPIGRTGPAWRGIVWPRLFYIPRFNTALTLSLSWRRTTQW